MNALQNFSISCTRDLIHFLSSVYMLKSYIHKFCSIVYRTEVQFRKRNGISEVQKQDLFGGTLYKETKITFILGRSHKNAIKRSCLAQNLPYVEKPKSDKDSWLVKDKGILLMHKSTSQRYLPIVGQKNGVIYSRYVDANGKVWDKKDIETFLLASQSYSDNYQTEILGLKTLIPFYLIKIETIKSISIGGKKFNIESWDFPKK